MPYVAFDIEIAKDLPPDSGDLMAHRPLGIACAALAWEHDGAILSATLCGYDDAGRIQPQMSPAECAGLVRVLEWFVAGGAVLLTHAGCGFDLQVLADESGRWDACRRLSWGHVDMLFDLFCRQGFAVGMDALAHGMGLHGKSDGMHGALAPRLWASGRYAEVLAYCAQDTRTTLQVALAVEEQGCVRWVSKRGRPCEVTVPRWLTVEEASALPLPDTSWMSAPWPRSKFTGWMELDADTRERPGR